MAGSFESWLNLLLRELNTDETVFCSYITGILEGDEPLEEKSEALEGILTEIIETDIEKVLKEILDQWNKVQATVESKVKDEADIDTKLAKLLENQKIATIVQRVYTEDELRIKQQILEQYSQLSGDEDEEEDDGTGAGGGSSARSASDGLTKNTNAHDVAQLVKERREQAKVDSQNKKLKDKEDREKQKQNKIDKKEQRKTVKGEKRR